VRGRIVDLDRASAGALGLIGPGVLPVTVERIR
jgi:rare lipoprotein A (peptidoglycan hydrolase)